MSQKKVFISYSHQDEKSAEGIARHLMRQGYDVWIDSSKLSLGKNWSQDIDYALENSDVVLAVLSANSVRRREVLREIRVALERSKNEGGVFKLYFIVVGKIHPSWFNSMGMNKDEVDEIISYLANYQYVQLDSHGSITIATMKQLEKAIEDSFNTDSVPQLLIDHENNQYIFENGDPEKVYDNIGGNYYFKVRPNDLAPSTVFPFTLDNQWLPGKIMDEQSKLHHIFMSKGFSSKKIRNFMINYQQENFYLALIHSRQVIVNRASILNNQCFRRYFIKEEAVDDILKKEQRAFHYLLKRGILVLFLYGNQEISPFVTKLPKYSIDQENAKAWNKVCKEDAIYCIREDWDNPIDKHSIELLKFCTTLAIDREKNELIAQNFNFNNQNTHDFLKVLKEIEMQIYCQTRMNGLGNEIKVNGYSRSNFYKSFIVDNNIKDPDPVLNCIFDKNNSFAVHLKKIIDVFYNSMFVNFFKCWTIPPLDSKPEDFFINQLFLSHGSKEVSVEELEYAFSEFFEHNNMFDLLSSINQSIYLKNWSLEKIVRLRESDSWAYYIELLENITNRSQSWEVDFSEIELLITQFLESVFLVEPKDDTQLFPEDDLGFTFRVCLGSKVIDIVSTPNINKLKEYPGSYSVKTQNNLSIQFQIGDLTKETKENNIFIPITLFDGKTDYIGGELFFSELTSFLVDQCGFVWINSSR